MRITSGMQNLIAFARFSLLLNPAGNTISFGGITETNQGAWLFQLYSPDGRLISYTDKTSVNRGISVNFDLDGLGSGVCLMKITSDAVKVLILKFLRE